MNTTSSPKIYVAGHRGMVGSAIVRKLHQSIALARHKLETESPA